MSTLPPLPPGTSLVTEEDSGLPPLPPGTFLASDAPAELPPLPPGTMIHGNPVRDALLARQSPGLPLSMLGPEAVDEVGRGIPLPGERPMPWFTVPVAKSWAPNDERIQGIITHPFDAMGEVFSRGLRTTGQAVANQVAPAAGPMVGQALSTATLGAVDPGIGESLLRGAAEVPADMAQAIAGDPAMTALVAAGMAVPGGAALAPFVHAAPTAYFGAEGVGGLVPFFGRTAEQRAQPSPLGLLRPGVWDTLDAEQKKDTFRGILGSSLMLGLPAFHLGGELRKAGEGLTSIEVGPRSMPDNPKASAFAEPIFDAMEGLAAKNPFDTLEQKAARIGSPTFLKDALEQAAPAYRVADLVVQVSGKADWMEKLADPKKELAGVQVFEKTETPGEFRRKMIVNRGMAEAREDFGAGGFVSGRPLWTFPALIRPELPLGTEEGAYKILGAQSKMAGLGDAEIAANAIIWKRHANAWENTTDLDVRHLWGMLTDRAKRDPLFVLNMFGGKRGAKALDTATMVRRMEADPRSKQAEELSAAAQRLWEKERDMETAEMADPYADHDVATRIAIGEQAAELATRAAKLDLQVHQDTGMPADGLVPLRHLAEQMLKAGVDDKTVWEQTGWRIAEDGEFRFEIDDSRATVKVDPSTLLGKAGATLREILDHPMLFEAWPELKRKKVRFTATPPKGLETAAGWVADNGDIWLTPAAYGEGIKEVLLHEIQHVIQTSEDFARGGNQYTGFMLLPDAEKPVFAGARLVEMKEAVAGYKADRDALAALVRDPGLEDARKAYKALDAAASADLRSEGSRLRYGETVAEAYTRRKRLAPANVIELASKADDLKVKLFKKAWASIGKDFADVGETSYFRDDLLMENVVRGRNVAENLTKSINERLRSREQITNALEAAILTDDMPGAALAIADARMAYDLYHRIGGEAEARLTESRMNLTPEERLASFPKPDVKFRDLLFITKHWTPREPNLPPEGKTFFQRQAGATLGSMTRFEDGRSMIQLFEGAHVGTLVHESAHFFRQSLYQMSEYAREDARPHLMRGLKDLEEWAGAKDGRWDERAEEKWARGAENYLRSGRAPVPKLQGLFDQFKTWLRAIYDDTAAAGLAQFSPEVEAFFDTYVLAEPVSTAKAKSWAILRQMQTEDREAYEAALALRDLPKAKQKLDEKFQAFERWIALSRQERVLLGVEDYQRFEAARASWGSAVAGDRGHAAFRRAREYVQKIEGLVWPDGKKGAGGDALALLTNPDALLDWKAKLQEGIKAAKYGNPYRTRINNLLGFFEGEARAFRDAAQAHEDASMMAGENLEQFSATQRGLMRKRASVRLLVREMRKATGEAKADPAAERAEVLKLAERYYASPKLLTELVDRTLVPRLEQLSKAILTAEATYRARTEAIAMRGNLGDSWGKSPIEDTAKAELLEKIRQDVAAQRTALRQVDGMAALMDGEQINPADIMADLNEGFREILGLEGTTEDTKLAIGEREADRLMEGEMDATTRRAMEEFATPLSNFRENFRPLLIGIRSAVREVFDPMSALDPYTFDPGRRVNKFLKALGLKEERPHTMTDAQMREARAKFVQADGAVNYWDKVMSPQWMDIVYRAFPDLKDRQLMTINRDIGELDFAKMEAKFRDREQKAHAAWEEAKRGGDSLEIKEAQRLYAEAVRRTNRSRGHVGVRGEWLSPRMAAGISMLARSMDALQNIGVRAGLWEPEAFRENYLPRIYRPEDVQRAKDFYRDSVLLGGPNKHGFQRVFDTLVEAYVIDGLKPATLDLAFLVDQYGRSLTESIQKRQLVSELQRIAPDMFEWVDKGRKSPTKGFMDISGFVSHSIIRPEKNAPEARFHAHRSIGVLLENMSKESVWDKQGPMFAPLRATKAVNMWLKKIQLAIDLYHLWQVTRVAMGSGVYGGAEHGGLPFRSVLKELNQLDPKNPKHALIKEMIHEGLDVSSGEWARRQIYKEVESQIIGEISPGAKAYHWLGHEFEGMSRYMWEQYVPALKMLVAARQLERLLDNPKTAHLERSVLVRAAATVANDKFGSATWSLKGRSKTLNDTLSIAFLAPQWLESRFRNVLGVAKKGPEGALWRDYWFGEGVMDTVRGKPADLETAPKRWATGYVVQGMILSAVGNMMVETMWPEGEEKEKARAERGANWFFSTTIPAQDKRGFPLHVSPFATRDYITAFAEDLASVAPALRWYRGRQGPLLRASTELVTGKDFAGRLQRPGFFSLETLGQLVDASLPWMHNIVSGSVGEVVSADEPGFSFWRTAARLTGGHTTSSWLPQVMDRAEFFKSQSQQWNRHASKEWAKWYYAAPGLGDIMFTAARARAMRHNRNLDSFIEEIKKNDRMKATLGPTLEKLEGYHMLVPEKK